jgi:hypothetical protein
MEANVYLLAVGAAVSLLGGLWFNSRANKKAKELLAPAVSSADYLSIFLWILAAVLGVAAATIGLGK